jgi:hypothetical protein
MPTIMEGRNTCQHHRSSVLQGLGIHHHQSAGRREPDQPMAHPKTGGYLPVPNVQALAQTWNGSGDLVPDRYVRTEEEATAEEDVAGCALPVVDLGRLLDPRSSEEELANLGSACQHWGYFQVREDVLIDQQLTGIFLRARIGLLLISFEIIATRTGNSRWSAHPQPACFVAHQQWRAGRGDPGREERHSRVLQAPARSQEGVRASSGRHPGLRPGLRLLRDAKAGLGGHDLPQASPHGVAEHEVLARPPSVLQVMKMCAGHQIRRPLFFPPSPDQL